MLNAGEVLELLTRNKLSHRPHGPGRLRREEPKSLCSTGHTNNHRVRSFSRGCVLTTVSVRMSQALPVWRIV